MLPSSRPPWPRSLAALQGRIPDAARQAEINVDAVSGSPGMRQFCRRPAAPQVCLASIPFHYVGSLAPNYTISLPKRASIDSQYDATQIIPIFLVILDLLVSIPVADPCY